jgi:hypothetical protein
MSSHLDTHKPTDQDKARATAIHACETWPEMVEVDTDFAKKVDEQLEL